MREISIGKGFKGMYSPETYFLKKNFFLNFRSLIFQELKIAVLRLIYALKSTRVPRSTLELHFDGKKCIK